MLRTSWPLLWVALFVAGLMTPAFGQSMMGEHDMSGTVHKIDHKKGTFQLKTPEAVLHVHFPPAAIKDVKNGDELTVHLAFKKGTSHADMKMK